MLDQFSPNNHKTKLGSFLTATCWQDFSSAALEVVYSEKTSHLFCIILVLVSKLAGILFSLLNTFHCCCNVQPMTGLKCVSMAPFYGKLSEVATHRGSLCMLKHNLADYVQLLSFLKTPSKNLKHQ